jgi:hypothetical protein
MFGAASSTRWQPRHWHGWQSNLYQVGLDWHENRSCCFPRPAVQSFAVQARQRCRAVDGDTLNCGGERLRMIGLDTPELSAPCPREERLRL